LQIIRRGKETHEERGVKAPFQNVVMEEEQFEEEDEIHCMEDKGSAAFLTLAASEESLPQDQSSQEWDIEDVLHASEQKRYNLRSKVNNVKENPAQRAIVLTKQHNIR